MELFLNVSIAVHLTAALLGLVTIPVLFFARKGTRFHIALGRIEIGVGTVVLAGAACIIFNPAYSARLQLDIAHYGWSTHVSKLLFAWIWGYFAYFFYSGLRIWYRKRGRGPMTHGICDYALSAVALALGGAGTLIALLHLVKGPLDWPRLVPMSAAMVVFAIGDIVSYARPPTTFRAAYLAHGSRMYFAWWMLLMGPLLRSHWWGGPLSFASAVVVVGGYLALRTYWLRQLRRADHRPDEVARTAGA